MMKQTRYVVCYKTVPQT